MKKILVVGQIPPPYGGQANMIKYMLDGKYTRVKLYHIRMCFTKAFTERGKFSIYKVQHLFVVIWNIWKQRFLLRVDTIYYPLSCAPRIAVLRDTIILGCTRFLFKNVIYHFHAAGISEELPKYSRMLKSIIYFIEQKPNLTITSSKYNPKDGEYLKSRKNLIIPLGVPDENTNLQRHKIGEKNYLTVLHMGLLNGSKGEGYVLDAVKSLNDRGLDVRFIQAGQFEDEEYERETFRKVKEYGLSRKYEYRGILLGEMKKQAFMDADIFCFPSYFHSESFGLVLLEAMMYQMPVIASRRRGLISVVSEGENGYLVDIHNSEQIADALEQLYNNRSLLKAMAKKSREIFVERYELSNYLKSMELAMSEI